MPNNWMRLRVSAALLLSIAIPACVESVEDVEVGAPPPVAVNDDPTTPPAPTPASTPPSAESPSKEDAVRFLMASTFGPNVESVDALIGAGYEQWLADQLAMPMRSIVDASWSSIPSDNGNPGEYRFPLNEFYNNAIYGEDQLRMRATYALSQILVISTENKKINYDGEGLARYMDILQEGAFGNYRDLLEEVTYSPMMGEYLTYAGNKKADPEMGSAPDENYAREIMQLFTIGLHELNPDGTTKTDEFGRQIETYTNQDITELAKVFTGLWWEGLQFGREHHLRTRDAQIGRMVMHDEHHSLGDKNFLGETIPATSSGNEAIQQALDILFEHPNTAPFISRQMIQRLTTSNPSPSYIARVARAFNDGRFVSNNGSSFGSGDRGDLKAVWAAILLDEEYLDPNWTTRSTFGKIREPFLRFTHWARVSKAPEVRFVWNEGASQDARVLKQNEPANLGQRPFASPSVFNFYRPDFIASGYESASVGLVAPEMEITNSASVIAYTNYMRHMALRDFDDERFVDEHRTIGSYSDQIALADETTKLVDHLDLILTAGTMSNELRLQLGLVIESIALDGENDESKLRDRVQLAMLLGVVSSEFLVQR